MAEEVADALRNGREAHVIHLGDVYYSGLPVEVQRHVLEPWPVTAAQAKAGVTSWSLNGNHDMYSGGYGYYDTLLADPRFAAQHSADGASTSFFRLDRPGLRVRRPRYLLGHGRAVQGSIRGPAGSAGGVCRPGGEGLGSQLVLLTTTSSPRSTTGPTSGRC